MFNRWPTKSDIEKLRTVRHERLQVEAARLQSTGVYNLVVPTIAGKFGVSASAFGVTMIFFPGADDFDLRDRMSKHNLGFGPLGKKRAIEAGLDLMGYTLGELKSFSVPVDLSFVTPFQSDVYSSLCSIPFGETITYGELAALAGHPGKARAVGMAMRYNPAPIFVPCHRVVSASGKLGGWSGPKGWKEWLLEHEGRTDPQ
jgi:methylated-DNA-[protein]-cysteine S-methyltransferase